MVLPLIGALAAPLLGGGLGLGTAALAGIGAGLGSLAQGDDVGTALQTGLLSGLGGAAVGKLMGAGAGSALGGEAVGNLAGGAGAGGATAGAAGAGGTTAGAAGATGAGAGAGASAGSNLATTGMPHTLNNSFADFQKFIQPQVDPTIGQRLSATLSNPAVLGAAGTTALMMPPPSLDMPGKKVYNTKEAPAPKDGARFPTSVSRSGVEADYGFSPNVYRAAEGGLMELENSGAEMSGIAELMGGDQGGQMNDKEVIVEAVNAIMGQSAAPEVALGTFVSRYGEDALRDLVERVQRGEFGDTVARGEGQMRGAGDGMEDLIPATIEGEQDVVLSNDEFVVPADVVSGLGNGSSDSGSRKLYQMMERVRSARNGTTEQPPQINSEVMLPA